MSQLFAWGGHNSYTNFVFPATLWKSSYSFTSSPKLITVKNNNNDSQTIRCKVILYCGLFKWVSSLHQVDKVLAFQLQHQPFHWTPRTDLLYNGLVGSPCSPRDSQVFSNTTVQKHQFFSAQLSHPYMTTGKTIALTRRTFVDKVIHLLFNMLSRLVITFLPRSKCL